MNKPRIWLYAIRVIPLLYITFSQSSAGAAPVSLTNFVLVNTNADGSVIEPSGLYPGDSSSFDLIGGNNGSGVSGLTTFASTAPAAGTVQFQWSYTSCYPPNQGSLACDTPTFDWAGYMVDQTFVLLADTDTAGVVS